MPQIESPDNPLAEGLLGERVAEPCAVIIFGASGDLTERKLIPALFNLSCEGYLPQRFAIIGASRTEFSDDAFREKLGKPILEAPHSPARSKEAWQDFSSRLFYHSMNFADAGEFEGLAERLKQIDARFGLSGNHLFYLATPPGQFETILRNLQASQMVLPPKEDAPWQRVVIEKPFGRDLESARDLNRVVASTLHESQAFRIDHYLGKETVQNLMTFRFANAIFEPIWNRRHVASVQITAAETVGVEQRGGYYDTAGALRDMVQNHLMQLLCLVAMEPPARMDADLVRNEKVQVLKTLAPMTASETASHVIRGQYGSGSIFGKRAPGYREEAGVDPNSITETYVAMRLNLDNWRWAGVPFFLRSGKRLPKRASEIAIQFRLPPVRIFQKNGAGTRNAAQPWNAPNLLLLRIQPDEGISLSFDAKAPGMKMRLRPVKMDFRYGTSFGNPSPEAYERLLLDAIIGDSTLFTRNDESEASWEFINSIQKAWQALPPPLFPNYEAGSWGPAEADQLFGPGEGSWRKL